MAPVIVLGLYCRSPAHGWAWAYLGDYLDNIEVGGHPVGHVDYGLSPLSDRVYIDMLEIERAQRVQGIGLAVLWQLWRTHQVPIVPLDQCTSSDGFR